MLILELIGGRRRGVGGKTCQLEVIWMEMCARFCSQQSERLPAALITHVEETEQRDRAARF